MNIKEIVERIKNSESSKIKFAVTDIDGILRGKYIHKEKFLNSVDKQIGFCDVIFGWDSGDKCYDNTEVTGWHTGYPDAKSSIDYSSYREIPWNNQTPFFLADFSADDLYANSACPRSLLKKVTGEVESLGFKPIFSQEFEWFNFRGTPSELYETNFQNLRPISPGMFGYSVLRSSLHNSYFNDIFDLLYRFDIPIEGMHTETGPGVLEATIIYDEILSAADKAVLFKTSVKEIAYQHEFMATFMAKWNPKLPGCGGHLHQSIWDTEKKSNLFFDERSKNKMSDLMEHYIAGQLQCLPEILPMFAPNINSYKRIKSGDWAPSTITWGIDNRTTALRVIPGDGKSTRVELRVPGADTNPYLAMAAALASGLYGIKNKIKLDIPETKGNGYKNTSNGVLSETLHEAVEKMAKSEIAKELFGDAFVSHFIKTREWECQQSDEKDDNWELKRYFEII